MRADELSLIPWLLLLVACSAVAAVAFVVANKWRIRRIRSILKRRPMMYGMEPIRRDLNPPSVMSARIAQALALRGHAPVDRPSSMITGPVAWIHGLQESAPDREEWEREHE